MTDHKRIDDPELFNDPAFEKFDAPAGSPVRPQQLTLDDTMQFHCHKGVSCFNECCMNIDLTLTPYDILRLARRLQITTTQFLHLFAQTFDLDHHGMPGLKMRPVEGGTACQFVTAEGCSVYQDRPTACRYYAMGTMGMRRKGESRLEDVYFMVQEPHCKGHEAAHALTVREYRREQGVEHYDEMNRDWFDIIVKKRSAGPTVGAPTERSFQLFYLASYDPDGFREFTRSPGFQEMFDLDPAERDALDRDDEALLRFAMRLLKQVLFGESTIPLKEGAAQRRYEQRKAAIEQRWKEQAEKYRLKKPGDEDGE
ncbi:MAG: YkgJ family cysteine cluster protein [Gammaproteobacteria bacterium]|nr:YkgJ family cysteine cluster protein [Gammaproteobacteria bacterium]NIR98576.1 YkgJ family cysteine cluster protein [Gammaproteobacteria bacterium]NIT64299.1 YkgJ family cysteine cluster protein [Gammaproteobacteria bacterium]NIV21223.1 YkgJ family cysteine cluster protein [Gammaproteobacteria bacterium]NIX10927.1 YkgJ family cysteine cluster protein [Gammaproteobacteria bacterium]